MNNITLIGRLTRDPELRKTQANDSVVNITIAVNRRKKPDGTQEVDFINCVAWKGLANIINEYFFKGHQIGITGSLRIEPYQDSKGNNRTKAEVLIKDIDFLESKKKESNYQQKETNNYAEDETGFEGSNLDLGISSDDLPF